MTSPTSSEAEFTRKLALGILSMLHQKGLLTSDEVDAVLYTARRAAQTQQEVLDVPASSPVTRSVTSPVSVPLTGRSPLSDPPQAIAPGQGRVVRIRSPLSDPPKPTEAEGLVPESVDNKAVAAPVESEKAVAQVPQGLEDKAAAQDKTVSQPQQQEAQQVEAQQEETQQEETQQQEIQQAEPLAEDTADTNMADTNTVDTDTLDEVTLDEQARVAKARWVRKEPPAPPTFDMEL